MASAHSTFALQFVTAGYFGSLAGDPLGGATRCLTNNIFDAGFSGTTAYFCGTQVRASAGFHETACFRVLSALPIIVICCPG